MKVYTITSVHDVQFNKPWELIVDDIKCSFIPKNIGINRIRELIPENIKNVLGIIMYQNLQTTDIIVTIFDEELYNKSEEVECLSETADVVSSYFANFFGGSWYQSDNSVHVGQTIAYTENGIVVSHQRQDNFSTATGGNTIRNFDVKDFEELYIIQRNISEKRTDNKDFYSEEQVYVSNRTYVLDPSNKNYCNFNSLEKALRFLFDARNTSFIPSKILNYMSILEVLFVTEKQYIVKQLKNNVSSFLEINNLKKISKSQITKAYKLRSSYVHGSMSISRRELEKNVEDIDEMCRIILKKIIESDELREIFTTKDNKVFKNYINVLKNNWK